MQLPRFPYLENSFITDGLTPDESTRLDQAWRYYLRRVKDRLEQAETDLSHHAQVHGRPENQAEANCWLNSEAARLRLLACAETFIEACSRNDLHYKHVFTGQFRRRLREATDDEYGRADACAAPRSSVGLTLKAIFQRKELDRLLALNTKHKTETIEMIDRLFREAEAEAEARKRIVLGRSDVYQQNVSGTGHHFSQTGSVGIKQ